MWMGFCVAMFSILSFTGFSFWWGLTGVSFDANCDTDDYVDDLGDGNRWEMCAGHGAIMSIVAVCSMAVAGIVSLINAMLQDDVTQVKLNTGRIHCWGIRIHFVFCFLMLLSCIALSVIGILWRKWVNWEDTLEEHQSGSLFAIDDTRTTYNLKIYDIDHYGWDCIAQEACEIYSSGTVCKTFEPLMDSGRFYLSLQITVICLLMVWLTFFIYSLFFSREWGHPVINHAMPHIAWIVHLGATVMWATMSKVQFEVAE